MQMEDKIFDVVIPMEDVMEIKGGKKQVVQRKVFPGYLLVKMVYDNDSWYVVRNTPGVTGFVASGTGTKPTPLSRREVEKILAVKEETQKKPEYRLEWEEGDVVRIVAGPFADFQGTIAEINVEQSKLKVLVNIFDRETPVELAIYEDRSFSFVTKQPPAAELLKQAAGVEKGSGEPNRAKVARVTRDQIRQIAEQKMVDLNANEVEAAMKIIKGTARSMGIEVRA